MLFKIMDLNELECSSALSSVCDFVCSYFKVIIDICQEASNTPMLSHRDNSMVTIGGNGVVVNRRVRESIDCSPMVGG